MKSLIKDDTFNRVVIKILSISVWLFFYISFIWFLNYRTELQQVIGFLNLALGFFIIFIPRSKLSIVVLQYSSLLFYICVLIVFL